MTKIRMDSLNFSLPKSASGEVAFYERQMEMCQSYLKASPMFGLGIANPVGLGDRCLVSGSVSTASVSLFNLMGFMTTISWKTSKGDAISSKTKGGGEEEMGYRINEDSVQGKLN